MEKELTGDKMQITKHYQDAHGVWHPIVLDPMGDQNQYQNTWLAEQMAEHAILVQRGVPIG